MYRNCKVTVKIADNRSGTSDEYTSSALCISYIDGFLDGFQMGLADPICYSGASLVTMARVYLAYMDIHPKMFDLPKLVGVSNSLFEAYPCRKK